MADVDNSLAKHLPCANLEATSGVQCIYQGPYRYSRRKPSRARFAKGDREGPWGTSPHMPFLICEPAESFRDSTRDVSEEARKEEYRKLLDGQRLCSMFKEREI